MAKLRMTYKNLKALRKSKEYQAALIDLVSAGVVPKATAEGLLGYNIPANLIIDDESSGTDDHIVDPGTDPTDPTDPGVTVTLLYFDATANDNAGAWLDEELTLVTNVPADELENIITAAKTKFSNSTIDTMLPVEIDPEYVEGESPLIDKYIIMNPLPETIEPGSLIKVYHNQNM